MRGWGWCTSTPGQVAKADKYFAKAYALSKNVSERERLYITGHYYQNVTGDIPKVMEALQEAIQTYPGQVDNYVNINVGVSRPSVSLRKALPYQRKPWKIQPDDAIALRKPVDRLLGLNRLSRARAEMERARKLGLDESTSTYDPNCVVFPVG